MTRGLRSADYKVPGGKLLRVQLTLDESTPPRVAWLHLTGDFFMHPEDAIDVLEVCLVGTIWQADALRTRVKAFFDTDVEVVGADVESVVHVILAAREP